MSSDPDSVTHPAFWSPSAWWLVALIALVAVASVLHLVWPDALGYDRGQIETGQWWRLLSAHLVHLNVAHTLMNLGAMALVFALLQHAAGAGAWWLTYALLSIATSVALYLLDPNLVRYVGASGVIHGLIAFGAVLRLHTHRTESLVLLAGLAAKLVYEATAGAVGGSETLIGAPVITAAHRYGAIAGAVLAMLVLLARRFSARPDL